MKIRNRLTIAATAVASIVVSATLLPACQGRKMSNMEPTGETVDVVIGQDNRLESIPDTMPVKSDSLPISE